jgi:hypothetical protein
MTITHHGRTFEVRTPEDIAKALSDAYDNCVTFRVNYCDRCEVEMFDDGPHCARCRQELQDAQDLKDAGVFDPRDPWA